MYFKIKLKINVHVYIYIYIYLFYLYNISITIFAYEINFLGDCVIHQCDFIVFFIHVDRHYYKHRPAYVSGNI